MKPLQRPALKDVLFASGGAACAAIVAAVALASIATPKDMDTRISAVEQQTAQTKRLFRSDRQAQGSAPGSVCNRPPQEQAVATRQALEALAAQSGLEMRTLDVRPEPPASSEAKLAPVRLRFEATGGYDAVVGLMDQLSREQPVVFVDALDLVSKTSTVSIVFTGRVFCSA